MKNPSRNWFSNFDRFDTPLVYEGIEYKTVENFFQAMKTQSPEIRRNIAAVTASKSKTLGRTVGLRPDWETIKNDVMEVALRHKFALGTSWQQKLMATGNEEIVEFNNWGDRVWGATKRFPDGTLDGENRLGKLLMKIRDEFRASKPQRLAQPNLQDLQTQIESYFDSLHRNASPDIRSNHRDQIFESALEALYGPDVWNWINNRIL